MSDKKAKRDVVLVEHPCSLDQKMEIRKEGYRVIDVRQKDNVDPDRVVRTIMKPKDEDKDGLLDGDKELEALRDECTALGIKFDGRSGPDKLRAAIEAKKAE